MNVRSKTLNDYLAFVAFCFTLVLLVVGVGFSSSLNNQDGPKIPEISKFQKIKK